THRGSPYARRWLFGQRLEHPTRVLHGQREWERRGRQRERDRELLHARCERRKYLDTAIRRRYSIGGDIALPDPEPGRSSRQHRRKRRPLGPRPSRNQRHRAVVLNFEDFDNGSQLILAWGGDDQVPSLQFEINSPRRRVEHRDLG